MNKLKPLVILTFIAAAGVGMYFWWEYQAQYPSTDDAYIQANILTISPQIAGKVVKVDVAENQYVKVGDPLFELDAKALQAAVDAAQAQLELANQLTGAGTDNISAAQAQLDAANASLLAAQQTFGRTEKLFKVGDMAQASLDTAKATLDQATAQEAAAQSTLDAARAQLGATGSQNANVRSANANLRIAQLNLEHATVNSTVNGWVANVSLIPGQVVSPGEPLFALVEENSWWIDANFKETDLERMRPGQPATISVDMYPGVEITGTVESIGAGSGAVFSLIPAQNATGNWVKVTQRFTARIKLDPLKLDPKYQLRAGASVSITVDTTGKDKQTK